MIYTPITCTLALLSAYSEMVTGQIIYSSIIYNQLSNMNSKMQCFETLTTINSLMVVMSLLNNSDTLGK